MPAGRPRKPTALKLLEGNKGKRPLNKKEPSPKRKIPRKPKGLSDKASEFWDHLYANLREMNVIVGADEMSMERMSELYADIQGLQEELRTNGRTYVTHDAQGNKIIRANPAAAQLRAADHMFKGFLTEFGLTPAARSRVNAQDEDTTEEDDADKHFGT